MSKKHYNVFNCITGDASHAGTICRAVCGHKKGVII